MRMRGLWCLIVLTLLSQLSGCATNPMTGRSQLSLVSEASAINQSTQLYASMIEGYGKQNKLIDDPAINKRLQTLTNRLIARAVQYRPDSQSWEWQVNVIDNDAINATCMPGGKMAVFKGLLDKIQPTDDELAQVMGHEIAHALANHGAEKMSMQILSQIAVAAVAVAATSGDANATPRQRQYNQQTAHSAAGLAAAAFITLPNSRGAESEADKLGIELAAQAGYDPAAAVTLWEKMGAANNSASGQQADFFSTHPSSDKRIEALQALQAPMQKIYRAALAARDDAAEYQYVRVGTDTAGFNSSNVRVIEEGKVNLAEPPAVDASKALAFYSPEQEAFKEGRTELPCQSCGLQFYLNQSDFKALQEKQDWRGLMQKVVKVGYHFDLSYYYLGLAARGLGYTEAAAGYFSKAQSLSGSEQFSCAKASFNKCDGVDLDALAVNP
ncbi:M48 family peptidase [Pseudomethylobacillus aquaticus]|uniref:M48 family peptidase n=1 Tax=Pseudomethylobacillus aquaticus TaxID=2676064 RepID=A0A3N0V0T1_9PROT|nr:M48 family metallopeptidase [Pseudomethylobacillus aquaticus]ROH86164.1 M48 family peptidase [Pseudomethylobacillus aquaticus]